MKNEKTCSICNRVLYRRSEYCIKCEILMKGEKTERERLDDEYKLALLKHKLKEK